MREGFSASATLDERRALAHAPAMTDFAIAKPATDLRITSVVGAAH
ncbi:MAG: hypothetical protein JWN07_2216, partial [Hyphomicrobiales bacterium]|nr:hypothetical protein [Hyphomicrobiales bacterium]